MVDSSAFSLSRLESLFNKYKDEDDQIGPAEIEKFCQDVEVDPEDVRNYFDSQWPFFPVWS